ncbi:MAG: HK97 family phage prohead protease [Candidatus Pacearchaeota archaeon]|jgi:HK97 family phage prohead protease
MPIPKPKDTETKDEFLKRCMGDSLMNDEYPDNDQRYAICNSLWKNKDTKEVKMEKTKKSYFESRSYPFEVRMVEEENEVPKIVGYAAVFNQLSDDLGGFREKIKRGFFSDVLDDDVRALFNHDENMVLGRTKNGTLILEEDKKGLKIEITPPETSYAKDLMNLIKRGDINQMSFQWITEKDQWDSEDKNNVVRTLVKAKELWDVSPVTFPAYPQTIAGMRKTTPPKQVYENHLEELQEDNSDEQRRRKEQEHISVLRRKLLLKEKEK